MIFVHLAVNGKAAMIDSNSILFAEELEGNDNIKPFTRVYLKAPIPTEDGTALIDVQESIEELIKPNK